MTQQATGGVRAYFAFFLVSGFCSLVYQIVWLRLAMAEFGVTTPLVSLFVSLFMAGLALGTWSAGWAARRFDGRAASFFLRAYAAVELFLAFSGIIVPRLFGYGAGIFDASVGAAAWGSLSYYAGTGLILAFILIPCCACMGATIPLAMAAIRKSSEHRMERSFSYLYVANVMGAAAGTVASAFLLIEILGFQGTLAAVALANALLGACALAYSRGATKPGPGVAERTARGLPSPSAAASAGESHGFALFMTGFTSMAMEIVWIRQFTPYLTTTIYTYAAILAFYLAATCMGSRIYRILADSGREIEDGLLWAGLTLCGLSPMIFADPRVAPNLGPGFQFARAALGVMPFCCVLGFITPMLLDRCSRGDADRAGRAYALNILGCIAGPLAAGFLLLPRMSGRWAVFALTLPLSVMGLYAAFRARSTDPCKLPTGRAMSAATAAFLLVFAVPWMTRGYEEGFEKAIVLRDYSATVTAVGEGRRKQLLINGAGVTGLSPLTKMMVHLPLALLPPAVEKRVLIICFGMGTTFRSAVSWGVPVTAVELIPSVPSLFRHYHADASDVLSRPEVRIVVDDGRRFLRRTRERYGVITIDPPPPVEAAGSSLLYSKEFYALAKRRLRDGGVLQQWIPSGERAVLRAVTRALTDSFRHVRAFRDGPRDSYNLHLIASDSAIEVPPVSRLAARLPERAGKDLLEWGPHATVEEQLGEILADEVPVRELLALAPAWIPAMRDSRPVNEYYMVRRTVKLLMLGLGLDPKRIFGFR